jgi:hypothetical protein
VPQAAATAPTSPSTTSSRHPCSRATGTRYSSRGERYRRTEWLHVLDTMRGNQHGGYNVVFDAILLLDQNMAAAAYDLLTTTEQTRRVFLELLFQQWIAALAAEASVLAGRPDARTRVEHAEQVSNANPMATTLSRRARALLDGDQQALHDAARSFEEQGAPYQRERTLALAVSTVRRA